MTRITTLLLLCVALGVAGCGDMPTANSTSPADPLRNAGMTGGHTIGSGNDSESSEPVSTSATTPLRLTTVDSTSTDRGGLTAGSGN